MKGKWDGKVVNKELMPYKVDKVYNLEKISTDTVRVTRETGVTAKSPLSNWKIEN